MRFRFLITVFSVYFVYKIIYLLNLLFVKQEIDLQVNV